MTAITSRYEDLTARVVDLVSQRFGPPTCTRGCSNCCRVAVAANTAEGLLLLDWIDEQPPLEARRFHTAIDVHVERLHELCRQMPGQDVTRAVWSLGNCPFLDKHVCSIYPARPLACRAVYVWHDNVLCGLENQPSYTPAELIQLRNAAFFDALTDEIDAGRLPFWGQLTLVADILRRHREAYQSGAFLLPAIDPAWLDSGLINFAGIEKDGTLDDARRYVDEAAKRDEAVFRSERPFGLPRAFMARSRTDLLPPTVSEPVAE